MEKKWKKKRIIQRARSRAQTHKIKINRNKRIKLTETGRHSPWSASSFFISSRIIKYIHTKLIAKIERHFVYVFCGVLPNFQCVCVCVHRNGNGNRKGTGTRGYFSWLFIFKWRPFDKHLFVYFGILTRKHRQKTTTTTNLHGQLDSILSTSSHSTNIMAILVDFQCDMTNS